MSNKWKLIKKPVDKFRILKSNEVAEGILISTSNIVISDAEKRELIQHSYDTHFLLVEECMLKFYETKGTSVIIEEIKNHEQSFVKRVSEHLEKVDTYFIEILTSEIHLVLNGKMPDSFLTERYISPLLESINLEFLESTSAKYIRRFLNTINPQFDNIEIEIEYGVTELKSKRKQEISTFINQLSSKRRNVAYYLSSIAANTKLSRMETISALKKVSTNHSSIEHKDYLESIDWFREFLYGNPLDLSLIQLETFIDMFLFYTQEIDIPTIAKKLNKIEHSTHSLSDSFNYNERNYIRTRLIEIAKLFEIDIFAI